MGQSRDAGTVMDALRRLQNDAQYQAAVAASRREMAADAKRWFWQMFLAVIGIWGSLAYFWGMPAWNLVQTLLDLEAPPVIGFAGLTLVSALITRKLTGY